MSADAPSPVTPCTYWLTRFVILRLLGLIYLVAFLVAANQILPLIGADGLLPVGSFLDRASTYFGGGSHAFMRLPSIFWWNHSDAALLASAWVGVALSTIVLCGWANSLLLTLLWLLYMSFVHVGQDWYGYGWEMQLLETGFLGIFLCPLLDGRPFPSSAPPVAVIWLFRWLIFRIMLGAGLIKIRGDSCWRNLTALYYHFETQPLPGPLSRWFHFLPHPVLRIGVVFNHVAELVAPWFVFWPRLGRRIAGAVIVGFQITIILSGNLSFLNWLTIVPALACFDDAVLARVLPRALVRRANAAAASAIPCRSQEVVSWVLAGIIVLLSIAPVTNMLSSSQIMNTSYDPLDLVNTYGAFGSVGKKRLNVVFEGADAAFPDDPDVQWHEYPYRGLPTDPARMPPQVAPYQLRLDWQMWFASMSSPGDYPWTLHLVWKLLHNDPGALSLFASNPFPDHPPRYIRAVLYRYAFTKPGNPQGQWWTRKKLGLWLPPLSADDMNFTSLLQSAGWLDNESMAPVSPPR
ncbi:MAG TPA: lipase maturation factor family protein [Chthoniobacterales bacterium]